MIRLAIFLAFIASVAWSQSVDDLPPPFGGSIFSGKPSNTVSVISDPLRLVGYGDRMTLRVWGAIDIEKPVSVDAEGAIFIPQVGPVKVVGKTMTNAQSAVAAAFAKTYQDSVFIDISLAEANAIAVYVTGQVLQPGQYDGYNGDTALDYVLRAGGVIPNVGSLRKIFVRRGGDVVANIDLYDFILNGQMPPFELRPGDTIFAPQIGPNVSVVDGARHINTFEAVNKSDMTGASILRSAAPLPGTSHALVQRATATENRDIYLKLEDFRSFALADGDRVSFAADTDSKTMTIAIDGDVGGQESYSLSKGASLKQLLSFISVDPAKVDLGAIHIERPSVAIAQREAAQAALQRIQQDLASQRSVGPSEAQVRSTEASMIAKLAEATLAAEFKGKITLARNGDISDILLQEGDKVIIPNKSDVVFMNGEVMLTNVYLYEPGYRIMDYVQQAGGLTPNADPESFIVSRPDGAAQIIGPDYAPLNGDRIMALPKIDMKNSIRAKEFASLIYQLAVGAGALVAL
jgi:protein involved in polysaccharide export with SLBB domain